MNSVSNIPECVGIILDGNRRWAKAKGKTSLEGHREGADTLERIVLHARDRGIAHIAAYVFSTENWKRTEEEVSYLMNLIVEGAKEHLMRLKEEGVRVRFIGERDRLAANVQEAVNKIEAGSVNGHACTLWVCLSYGGRAEITEAVRALTLEGGEVTEESIRSHMWSAEMPDPDLIIRTSGEMRLSNFLLWQAAYSELFFTNTLWPDFSPEEFDRILEEYGNRERRRGK
jgi:undecaprenyl diphosphate synthase